MIYQDSEQVRNKSKVVLTTLDRSFSDTSEKTNTHILLIYGQILRICSFQDDMHIQATKSKKT